MDKQKLISDLKEAQKYVDLFLSDLEEDEPTIDQPKDCLDFITYAIYNAIDAIKKEF